MILHTPRTTRTNTLFPYTTLFLSDAVAGAGQRRRSRWETATWPRRRRRARQREPGRGLPLHRSPRSARDRRRLAPAVRTGRAGRQAPAHRSEERPVGTEWVSTVRSRWSPALDKKNTQRQTDLT